MAGTASRGDDAHHRRGRHAQRETTRIIGVAGTLSRETTRIIGVAGTLRKEETRIIGVVGTLRKGDSAQSGAGCL